MDAVIATPRRLKAAVLVGHEAYRERDCPGKAVHNFRRVVGRSVVGHHDLKPPVHAPLKCQRQQRATQVLRTLIRRDDHGDIGGGRQLCCPPTQARGSARKGGSASLIWRHIVERSEGGGNGGQLARAFKIRYRPGSDERPKQILGTRISPRASHASKAQAGQSGRLRRSASTRAAATRPSRSPRWRSSHS